MLSKGENTDSPGLSVTYDYQVLFFQLQYFWGFLNRPYGRTGWLF